MLGVLLLLLGTTAEASIEDGLTELAAEVARTLLVVCPLGAVVTATASEDLVVGIDVGGATESEVGGAVDLGVLTAVLDFGMVGSCAGLEDDPGVVAGVVVGGAVVDVLEDTGMGAGLPGLFLGDGFANVLLAVDVFRGGDGSAALFDGLEIDFDAATKQGAIGIASLDKEAIMAMVWSRKQATLLIKL